MTALVFDLLIGDRGKAVVVRDNRHAEQDDAGLVNCGVEDADECMLLDSEALCDIWFAH